MKLFNNHPSSRGLPSCHSERAFHYCHSEGALRLCHPEERSDEGSSSGQAARPKNLNVAQGKLPEEESLAILRFAQNDIWLLLNTLGEVKEV